MGLTFTDKDSWQRWQQSRRRLHGLKDRLSAPSPQTLRLHLWSRGPRPRLLVACDSTSPTNHHSLLAPLEAGDVDVIVATPAHLQLTLPGKGWRRLPESDQQAALAALTSVASIGDHLAVGAWAHELATSRGLVEWVVQHGVLTPFAPPPPFGARYLAWSEADASFVREGRSDLDIQVTGSAMLNAAAANPAEHISRFMTPVYLGQLHGAELSRLSMTQSTTQFWRETRALYRPHPREEDKLSRFQHRVWKRMGMEFAEGGALTTIDRPVVAAFSTGVLEAAARGVPSWVFHSQPPRWLEELWDRYELSRWGDPEPTRYREPDREPARRIGELWIEP